MNNDNILSFLESLSYKLNDTHLITLLEYEKFNKIKNEWSDRLLELQEENNIKIEDKLLNEKITSNKKEYEFISNYFLNENEKIRDISTIENSFKQDENLEEINENNIGDYSNLNLYSFKNIKDIIENNKVNLSNKELPKQKKSKYELPSLKKNKREKSNYNSKKDNEEIEKEMEEELNNQIFKYTKMMKISAKNFGHQLVKDNQFLQQIENIQTKDMDKTRTQNQRLQEFNSLITLGFFKKLLMIIVVITTFIFTLLTMRIFPRLA